jgi:hypothetical protein
MKGNFEQFFATGPENAGPMAKFALTFRAPF